MKVKSRGEIHRMLWLGRQEAVFCQFGGYQRGIVSARLNCESTPSVHLIGGRAQ